MRRLVVHGYETYAGEKLSKLTASVCQLVAEIEVQYEQIILLGGQHLLEQGNRTVDQIMCHTLIRGDVPVKKLIPWSYVCPEQRPPRDTMEEVDILPSVLAGLDCQPLDTSFDVACIWYFTNRIRYLYRQRGAGVGEIHGAGSFDLKRMLDEIGANLVTRWAPDGDHPIFKSNRAGRNVFPTQPNGEPWKDNLPSAWLPSAVTI